MAQAYNTTVPILCACSKACGPWIFSANGYSPILKWIDRSNIATWIYHNLSAVQIWVAIAAYLYVGGAQRYNSISVNTSIAEEAATAAMQEKSAQAREIVKLRRKLRLQKKQLDAE